MKITIVVKDVVIVVIIFITVVIITIRWISCLLLLLYLYGTPCFWWVFFLRMWPSFLNPTTEGVTFRLRERCVLGMFLLPAFTRLGHKCQDYAWTYVPKHTCSWNEYGQICYVSMGNLVIMLVDLYMWLCMCLCVDMYLFIYMIVSCKFIRAHIAFVCTLWLCTALWGYR